MVNVFLTGATGYVGGELLLKLLALPDASKFQVSALVRGEEKAAKLRELGVRAVVGSLDDSELLSKEAESSDVVIHIADSDHMPSAKALIAGLVERRKRTGKNGILVQTSGTGFLLDGLVDDRVNPTIYSDLDVSLIDSIPDTQPHRNVDLVVRAAGASGEVDTYIVAPPTIYGVGNGPFKGTSIQIPILIRAAIKAGRAFQVGKGVSVWSDVHVADVADFFIVLLRHALANPQPQTPHPFDQYYFPETGEHSWGDAVRRIGKELHDRGVVASAEPGVFTQEIFEKVTGLNNMIFVSGNARSRADRARQIGWKPSRTSKDFFKSIGEEIDWILEHEKLEKISIELP